MRASGVLAILVSPDHVYPIVNKHQPGHRNTLIEMNSICDHTSQSLQQKIITMGLKYKTNERCIFSMCFNCKDEKQYYPLSKHHVYITVIRDIRDMWGRCAEQIL